MLEILVVKIVLAILLLIDLLVFLRWALPKLKKLLPKVMADMFKLAQEISQVGIDGSREFRKLKKARSSPDLSKRNRTERSESKEREETLGLTEILRELETVVQELAEVLDELRTDTARWREKEEITHESKTGRHT